MVLNMGQTVLQNKYYIPLPSPQNFVRNSCNVRDQKTLSQLWDIFSGATQQQVVGPRVGYVAAASVSFIKSFGGGGGGGGGDCSTAK